MRSKLLLPVLLLGTLPLTGARAPAAATRYEFDRNHSEIGFTVKHMLVTNVRGRFKDFDGFILVDEQDITKSTAEVTIRTASIDTEVERRDNHLRSDDFFNAEQFPAITFKGKRVEKRGEQLALVGDLTIRDVTNEVRIPFTMSGPVAGGRGTKRIGVEGELTIDRFDYKLKYNNFTEGVQVVGDEVKIHLAISARTAPPASATP